ncbi:bacterial type II secretion system protein F domain protein [mine drainage metagenome]|uniref:Bacterial type II secretion system protein F domain protein n=1 Tax=mine drainage metagenome TaxID=410659 RepID=A0A1J5SAD9_9ZZZZ
MTEYFPEGQLPLTLILALATGLSAALIAGLFARAVAAIPEEQREFKDSPPLAFRLVWWPIQWISHYLGPIIFRRTHHKLLAQLRKAGLDYSISPVQFIAARSVCALILVTVGLWVLASFAAPESGTDGVGARAYFQVIAMSALFGWLYPAIWLKDRLALRRRELLKTLPFYLDIITLCVEAGLNVQGAMKQAVAKGPKGVLRDEFQRVLRDIRAGKARAEALLNMAERLNEPGATHFTTAVIQAESMGMNLGPVLRAQADQRRAERFQRAERAAMEAPVKLLFPLIAFIFPCTFIVLFFPIVMKFMNAGL